MAKNNKYQQVSPQTKNDATKAAKATQRPGQTKEQTKLIVQGVERAINHYKKQQKEKSRELNRRLQKASKVKAESSAGQGLENKKGADEKQCILPWSLLAVSWMVFAVYVLI